MNVIKKRQYKRLLLIEESDEGDVFKDITTKVIDIRSKTYNMNTNNKIVEDNRKSGAKARKYKKMLIEDSDEDDIAATSSANEIPVQEL